MSSNTVTLTLGKLTFTLDASDELKLFKELGHIEEIFGETKCKKCGSEDIKHVMRTAEGTDDNGKTKTYKYYEIQCTSCYARLSFGQKQEDQSLFPIKKKDGSYLNNGGWVKYNKETGKEE